MHVKILLHFNTRQSHLYQLLHIIACILFLFSENTEIHFTPFMSQTSIPFIRTCFYLLYFILIRKFVCLTLHKSILVFLIRFHFYFIHFSLTYFTFFNQLLRIHIGRHKSFRFNLVIHQRLSKLRLVNLKIYSNINMKIYSHINMAKIDLFTVFYKFVKIFTNVIYS